jgi:hypothetical protein
MILSICYGTMATLFLIGLTQLILQIFYKVKSARLSIVYISLFGKMVFLAAYTLAVKEHLEYKIIYATIILFGIMFSTVNIVLKLFKDEKF